MKKHFTLSVNDPCSENWNNFKTNSTGGFCDRCCKNVLDFTQMSEPEITYFFKNASTTDRTCGRFRPGQLRTYHYVDRKPRRNNRKWPQALLALFTLFFLDKTGFAQSEKPKEHPEVNLGDPISMQPEQVPQSTQVQGIVMDEYGNPIPGVNVLLKGGSVGIATDNNGKFEFPQNLYEGDVLIFTFIGFETQEFKIKKFASPNIKIKMNLSCEVTLGEVNVERPYLSQPPSSHGFMKKLKNIFK